jgi:hypothetical protein
MGEKLTKAQRAALMLLQSGPGGSICSDDERCDRFSDDAQPIAPGTSIRKRKHGE